MSNDVKTEKHALSTHEHVPDPQASAAIKQGLARAQAQGVRLGRPQSVIHKRRYDVVRMRAEGMRLREIAAHYNVAPSTVWRLLRKVEAEGLSCDDFYEAVLTSHDQGKSVRAIADNVGTTRSTILRILREDTQQASTREDV